jgi:hypothetical protein
MSEEDSTSKKRKPRVKKESTTLSLSGLDVSVQAQVESALKEAILRFGTSTDIKSYKLKDLVHLDNIAQEFLKTFIILGYDITGEKVHILHAETPHDRDALVEHLRTTLINILNNNE